MAIAVQALTSTDRSEVQACLDSLVTATAGYGFMHESFNMDDAATFTRPWFAWANSLFAEVVIKISEDYPDMIFSDPPIELEAGAVKTVYINRHGEKKWR